MNFEAKKKELIQSLKQKGIKDKKVLEAMSKLKRHLFVSKNQMNNAYEDRPLSIGSGQTISQPYTVAFMLQELELKKSQKVLEIGTGSGYNAALISEITKSKVYSTEVRRELSEQALKNLKNANITKVKVIHREGSIGYKTQAPYNRIIITAAVSEIPHELLDQLKPGGILLAPVGTKYHQVMKKIRYIKNKFIEEELGDFVFVEMVGKYGFK